ncbi:MAG: invasin domain 3-containing protein, partial [Anaerolineae bacterium]
QTESLAANSVRLTVSASTQTAGEPVGLRAEVLDGDGQPVGAGIPVSFTTTLGDIQPPSGETDVAGVVTATLTSTRTGTAIVTAHASDAQGVATVLFNPGPPEAIGVAADPPAMPVDGSQSQIMATLDDHFGNRVGDGITVTFASSLGAVNPMTTTSVAGRATTILTSGPVHGRASVTATVGSYTGTTGVEFLPADLRILSTHSPTGDISPGTTKTYTITFENAGNAVARDVVITNTLPVGLTDTSFQSSGAAITTTQGTAYIWEVEDLSPGEGGAIVLHGRFDREYPWSPSQFVANIARIGSATAEGNRSDNSTSAGNVVVTADVFVQTVVDDSGTDLAPGGKIKYRVFLGNYGPAPAQGLTITSTLPAFTTLWKETSYEIPGLIHVSGDDEPVQTWRYDGIVTGSNFGSFVIWLNIDPHAPGGEMLRHRIEVSSDTADGDHANNLQVIERRLSGINLAVALRGPATVIPARMITYTLRYTNTGTLPAEGVILTDILPAGVSFIDASRPARVEPDRIEWDLGSVADGQWGQIIVVARVGADVRAGQDLRNTLAITTTSTESFTGDNTSVTDTLVVPDAPDSLTLDLAPTTLAVGTTVSLTVAVADQFANPIDGLTVTLTTTVGSITPTVLTTLQGVATASFTAPESPAEGDITAMFEDLSDVTHVVIEPGPASDLRLEASTSSLPADGHSSTVIRAYVTDQFGNPVQDGTRVIFDADHGVLYNGQSRHEVGTFDGIASTILTTDRTPGRAIIIASAGTASAEIAIEFVEVPLYKIYLPFVKRNEPASETAQVP